MKVFIFILILFVFRVDANAEDFKYKFFWLKVPVADLTINLEENDNSYARFRLATRGPLKIFRNYESSGELILLTDRKWKYQITGSDRGQFEEKLLIFDELSYPVIINFIDDKGVSPISANPLKDSGSVDPFTSLLRIIDKISVDGTCNRRTRVFDGKRRYLVDSYFIKTEFIKNKFFQGNTKKCKLKIIEDSFQSKKESVNILNEYQWPFNGEVKYLDIWFNDLNNFMPVKFAAKTPIGNIEGYLSSKR